MIVVLYLVGCLWRRFESTVLYSQIIQHYCSLWAALTTQQKSLTRAARPWIDDDFPILRVKIINNSWPDWSNAPTLDYKCLLTQVCHLRRDKFPPHFNSPLPSPNTSTLCQLISWLDNPFVLSSSQSWRILLLQFS